MSIETILPSMVGLGLLIVAMSLFLRLLKQPQVIGYILVGILAGPYILNLVDDTASISFMGELGIVLLLFFIGMEVSIPRLFSNWKIAIFGTGLQIVGSVAAAGALGNFLGWPFERSILLGFVISLSSTAVVLKVLQDWKELDTKIGQDVLSVLLVQDIAIVPMILLVNVFGGGSVTLDEILYKIIGGSLVALIIVWIIMRKEIRLPIKGVMKKDKELEVFVALIICFGLALITSFFGISAALGAFVAGMLISSAKETHWVQENLHPFRVVFVALFFLSIGMLMDIGFLFSNIMIVLSLVVLVFITNTGINMGIFRLLGRNWKESLYGGSLLSQIGEFSFLISAISLEIGMITYIGYQMTISVVSVSLLLSPIWISFVKKIICRNRCDFFSNTG